MSLSESPSLPLPGYSNSLRVTHPDVVIGLLCADVARTFWVPQGSGSLCLHVSLYKQVLWEQKKRCKKNPKTTMGGRNGFTENHSLCWCTSYSTSVSWIINSKALLCSPQQKQWRQMRKTERKDGLCARVCVSSSTTTHNLSVSTFTWTLLSLLWVSFWF